MQCTVLRFIKFYIYNINIIHKMFAYLITFAGTHSYANQHQKIMLTPGYNQWLLFISKLRKISAKSERKP